ncbi:MAG: zinc metallopeptidase [Oscillospiraceae bacterium]|nr:zinc metallopeptidase [Oscillospiraceae bacterium]
MWASWNVKTTFAKYNKVGNRRGYTAAQIARRILDMNGLSHIRLERVSGDLTDHFDPSAGVVRLSDSTYNSTSVGALGVAAHECGHAVQYDKGYFPMKVRAAIIPMTQIGSSAAMPLALLGVALGLPFLVEIGILLFCAVVAFQLVTLPVEFNASRRAMQTLEEDRILEDDELKGSRKVLTAAALTYVAALLVALGNLLRLMSMRNNRRR